MSQTCVTNFYSSRKRFKEPKKIAKNVDRQELSKTIMKDTESTVVVAPSKVKASNSKARGKKVNKVTDYLKPLSDTTKTGKDGTSRIKNVEATEIVNEASSQMKKTEATEIINKTSQIEKTEATEVINEAPQIKKTEAPRTPKRNLSNPEELTPTKKKVFQEVKSVSISSPAKHIESSVTLTPQKLDPNARRKLQLRSSPNRFVSPRKISSPVKHSISPQKAATYENISTKNLASILNESRSKILFGDKLDDLKKSLEKFSQASAKSKEYQSNPYRITSVISSAKTSDNETNPIQKERARSKYGYLAAPESRSLILPEKYKVLAEIFRCLDTVVSMLNNRKEKITFEKLQNGVQKMMNKNFTLNHLARIMTVFPAAYSLQYEKNDSYIKSKNTSSYHLVISPKLANLTGNPSEVSSSKSNKNNQITFIQMTPQHLVERKNIFLHNLTSVTKRHHEDFLKRINFPSVANNAIIRWHPKFNVEGVPDIPAAKLPEEPESKVLTAKDVLNKIRGSVQGRVEKALQSVSDEHKTESNEKSSSVVDSKNSPVIKKQSSALKGICTDLLEKIRARESAKLFENMTRSVDDEKRSAMLERLPKIVNILWHYFVAERKAAVPVDTAVEKIIHSFNSLTTPEEVKAHLQLIVETMPGWLSFIKISKGEYITMDKKRDINEMIANIK